MYLKVKLLATHDITSNIIASLAVISPAWLPTLSSVSAEAALLLPIMGVIWLAVQIFAKLRFKKGEDD